jgi:hypothetical protein
MLQPGVRLFTDEASVSFAPGQIARRGNVAEDVLADVRPLLVAGIEETSGGADVGPRGAASRIVPLSFVGKLFSWEQWDCSSAGGPEGCSARWQSVDVSTGAPADITEWVDEAALVAALLETEEVSGEIRAVFESLGRKKGSRSLAQIETELAALNWGAPWRCDRASPSRGARRGVRVAHACGSESGSRCFRTITSCTR